MRFLIVDGTNIFVRCFSALPTLNSNGSPVGGVVGFLGSVKRVVEICHPEKVIIVFDGEGGSQKRREIYQEYKKRSKPFKLKAKYIDPKDTEQNIHFQLQLLLEILEFLPVTVIRISKIEADDVVAYLSHRFEKNQKVIFSGDKDFYQLLNEETIIFNPGKKTLVTKQDCIQEFGIHPNNFAIAKAIIGDKSDNINGISGIGFKTLAKILPELKEYQKTDISGLFDLCAKKEKQSPKFQSILAQKDLVIRNFDLVQLENTIMGIHNIERIKNILDRQVCFSQTSLRLKFLHNGIVSIGQSFFDTMLQLSCKKPE